MESDFSFARNLMERKWKPSNSLKRSSESWKQKIIPTENWKNYIRHLASSFMVRAAGIFVSLRSTDGFINCSPQYKNSTEFVLRKKVKLNRINYQHMFTWTRCLLLSMSKVFACQAGAARTQWKASKVLANRWNRWIKLRFTWAIHALSVCCLSLSFSWLSLHNCQLYPVVNVTIRCWYFSVWFLGRNVFISPPQFSFALYLTFAISRKFCPLCHKQVIACFLVKLRINITCVFRSCRNCPRRYATRAISATSENTRDINP